MKSITFTFTCMHLADALSKATYSVFRLYIFCQCIALLIWQLPQLTELMIDYGTDSKCEIWIQLEDNPRTVFYTRGSYYGHLWFFTSYILLRSLMYVIINSHLISVIVPVHCFSPHLFSAGTNAHHTSAVSSCKCVFRRFGSVWDSCTETVPYVATCIPLVGTFVEQVILHFRIRLQT